jgi:hypothetical protein
MEIDAVVDRVPTEELELLCAAASAAAVPGADRAAVEYLIDGWCDHARDADDDTDEVVAATILALGIRAILADRAERSARNVQVAA